MVESINVGASPYAELFDPVGVIFITIINTMIAHNIAKIHFSAVMKPDVCWLMADG